MAVLLDSDRKALHKKIMSEMSSRREPIDILKLELRAAIDAVDQGVADSKPAVFNGISPPVRAKMSTKLKDDIFDTVVEKRKAVRNG